MPSLFLRIVRVASWAGVAAALLLVGCASGATTGARPTQRVPGHAASTADASEPAAKPWGLRANRESMFERIRRRDAVVIRPDEQPVKGSAFGPLLNVQPPSASLPGWR